ncbi:MAG: glycyl-radical enzyme activating protein [Promethearchaeota archaeon]|nr:MAG: glycyl-radical enzyme activating protein [Candidatus Lokiarchaeota archaeon]
MAVLIFIMTQGYIFDVKKFALHDGPGIRTTIFLKGCSLRCLWCHNPESQVLLPQNWNFRNGTITSIGKQLSVEKIIQEIEQDIIFFDESQGGVTISGGEPLHQPEFLLELVQNIKKLDLNIALDTTGFSSWENISLILPYIDIFLYDLKFIDASLHKLYTGVDNTQILTNLQKLFNYKQNVNIRIPIIPSITDTKENLSQIRDFLVQLGQDPVINLLPYNELGIHKYEQLGWEYQLHQIKPPSGEEITLIQSYFQEKFSQVAIGG